MRGLRLAITIPLQALVRPLAKAGAAALTLGCGVPLGPEGPSVQLGSGVAAGLQRLSPSSEQRRLSLLAAGSAAGLSAGFGATLAGAFFAVEAVLQPSSAAGRPSDPPSLTASMVLIAAVLASVVSRAGLGAEPTFVVPAYDISPLGELPLFLGLGVACGGISLAFAFTTTLAERAVQGLTARGVSPSLLPPLAGLLAGGVALAYPETLYNGFSNVDTILAAPRALYPPALLMTLVAAKVGATSVCRASGLVGGVYAPSLFMGAALGAAYGAAASQLPFAAALGFGSPAAYALVGMAATLAAVCRVPLTAILLMFEYTQDFRMLLPLMASVGVAAWVASVADERALASTAGGSSSGRSGGAAGSVSGGRGFGSSPTNGTLQPIDEEADAAMAKRAASTMGAVFDDRDLSDELGRDQLIARVLRELPVSVAMRTQFLTLASDASLVMAAAAMVGAREKVAVLRSPEDQAVIGVLTHDAVQRALDAAASASGAAGGESAATAPGGAAKACANAGGSFQGTRAAWSRITPDTPLADALAALTRGGLRQLPVVPVVNVQRPPAVGLLEAEAVADACAMELTQRALRRAARMQQQKQEGSERGSQTAQAEGEQDAM
jgi:H+/Cl- antiporter ClcA